MPRSDDLPKDIVSHLKSCGTLLADRMHFSPPNIERVRQWDKLIDEWADDESLPLFVRYRGNSAIRGSFACHKDGRKLVSVDNSPAHWVWSTAIKGYCYSIAEIASIFKGDLKVIPVAHTLGAKERASAGPPAFATALTEEEGKTFYLGQKGYKLAHIDDVKLAGSGDIRQRKLDHLKEHFKRLMKPSNMFVVPLRLHGLAEVKEIIECFRGWSSIGTSPRTGNSQA